MFDRLYLAAKEYVEASDLHKRYWAWETELGHYVDGRLSHDPIWSGQIEGFGHPRGSCPALDWYVTYLDPDGTDHSLHDAYWELVGAVHEQAEDSDRLHKQHPPKVRA